MTRRPAASSGPKWLLEERITKPDFAISAGFSYAVVTAHNGVLHLEVTVKGRQAHAAMPESGADALGGRDRPCSRRIYQERKRLAKRKSKSPGIGSPKITVGLISGGINTNVVPDRIVMRLDRRLIPEENGAKVEQQLVALIKRAAKGKGIAVECRRVILAEPLKPVPGVEQAGRADAAPRQARVQDRDQGEGRAALHRCAALRRSGIPTVLYGAGPRSILEANAHGPTSTSGCRI